MSDDPTAREREDAHRIPDPLGGQECVVDPVELRLCEHRRQLRDCADDSRQDDAEDRQRRVPGHHPRAGEAEIRENWVREVDREREAESGDTEEEGEREREVALGGVPRPRGQERSAEVVDERPEPREEDEAGERHERESSREPGRGEPEEADGDEPQLPACQPAGVERDAGPDGHELSHRAHDGDTDPAGEQEVQARDPAREQAGRGPQHRGSAENEQGERDEEVPQGNRHRRPPVRVDVAWNDAHGTRRYDPPDTRRSPERVRPFRRPFSNGRNPERWYMCTRRTLACT